MLLYRDGSAMTLKTLKYAAVVTGLLLVLAATWLYVTQIRPLELYRGKNRQIADRFRALENQPPDGIDSHVWKEMVTITNIGFGNVFFSPTHASYAELLRFETDLDEKLRTDKPMTVETLRWVWKRLADTGPHGKQYSERMIELFEERAAFVKTP